MDLHGKTLTIVYQFGKVASTSLVETLKANQALDVHQSHFLGESALQRIVPIAVDKATNGYFHGHLKGQLSANLDLTYRMNRVLGGEGATPLKVISLSREPLNWLRSSILQDIVGYRPDLLALAAAGGVATQNEDDDLRWAIEDVLSRTVDIIEKKGGFPSIVAEFLAEGGKGILSPVDAHLPPIVRKIFFLALRPHTWFDEHFRPCFGFGPEDFAPSAGIWTARQPRADFAILRYEDLDTHMATAFEFLGLGVPGALVRENVSQTKAYADVVRAAFSAPCAEVLRGHLASSDYSKRFGYSGSDIEPKVPVKQLALD
ncbi:MAG: hypothetical protein AAFY31_00770 [Pseudomonadota bacterium]